MQLVLRDVRNGFVSIAGARQDYGVVVLEKPWRIDVAATAAMRAEICARRKWEKVPVVRWAPEVAE